METPRPTIDLESPSNRLVEKIRKNELRRRFPKYEKKDYQKMYRVVNKYRRKQNGDEDPDPFAPSYVFYCFHGIRVV